MRILLSGHFGRGINGVDEMVLTTDEVVDLSKDFIEVKGRFEDYDEYPKSKYYGIRTYIINRQHIIFIQE